MTDLSHYLGSPSIRYVLIDPARRSLMYSRIERTKAEAEFHTLLRGPSDKVKLSEERSTRVFDLHELWVQSSPADAECFWFRPNRHAAAQRFRGRAILVARSADGQRMASARMHDLLYWFYFDEPVIDPEPTDDPSFLQLQAQLTEVRQKADQLANSLQKTVDGFGGQIPGHIRLDMDARGLINVLEAISLEWLNLTREAKFAFTKFVTPALERLIEEGYLDEYMMSGELRELWLGV